MKKILSIFFMLLLGCNIAFASTSTTSITTTEYTATLERAANLLETCANKLENKNYDGAYADAGEGIELLLTAYRNLQNYNIKESDKTKLKSQFRKNLGMLYALRGNIDENVRNNFNGALSEYRLALEYDNSYVTGCLQNTLEYIQKGNYSKAESMLNVIIAAPGLERKKLADAYKIRAQIRQKLKNTTGAQEDYKKYNELIK